MLLLVLLLLVLLLLLLLLLLLVLLLLLLLLLADAAERELEVPARVGVARADAQGLSEGVRGLAEESLRLLMVLLARGGVALPVEGEAEVVVGVRADLRRGRRLGREQERLAGPVELAGLHEREPAVEVHAWLARQRARRALVVGERALGVARGHALVARLDVVVLDEEGIPRARLGRDAEDAQRGRGRQLSGGAPHALPSARRRRLGSGAGRRLRRPIHASGNSDSSTSSKKAGSSARA